MTENRVSILIIYTGGTIGMVDDPETGSLSPFDFRHIMRHIPELHKFGYDLSTITFEEVIDSSNISPDTWVHLAELIGSNYDKYDGFVVLHGTDTMAYTASALSFLLENLDKPVVFTGSQLPIGMLRTDGKENFISAVEIAAAQKNGQPLVPEVTIFFENKLYRGNRTTKHSADYFDAFRSFNYPELAKAGINISYNYPAIRYPVVKQPLKVYHKMDSNIAVIRIFPGIKAEIFDAFLQIKGLKGLIIETFGSGNAPTLPWLIEKLSKFIKKGIIVLNVTQCSTGSVDMSLYETGVMLSNIGVLSGYDITIEAAVTKMMFLLGQKKTHKEVEKCLLKSIRGELNE